MLVLNPDFALAAHNIVGHGLLVVLVVQLDDDRYRAVLRGLLLQPRIGLC
jgi:hypothetical protein